MLFSPFSLNRPFPFLFFLLFLQYLFKYLGRIPDKRWAAPLKMLFNFCRLEARERAYIASEQFPALRGFIPRFEPCHKFPCNVLGLVF